SFGNTPAPATAQSARAAALTAIDGFHKASAGRLQMELVEVLGPIRVDVVVENCNYSSWLRTLKAELSKRNLRPVDHEIAIIPRVGGCTWQGMSTAPILINSLSPYIIMHELGHHFGMGHSSVKIGNYPLSEYGDWTDVMGTGPV